MNMKSLKIPGKIPLLTIFVRDEAIILKLIAKVSISSISQSKKWCTALKTQGLQGNMLEQWVLSIYAKWLSTKQN